MLKHTLGGFLGSGKTTTLLRLALHLQRKGVRVGLITNDQADGLVDTALAAELQLPVREITGGCFCCRSESLVDALERLSLEQQPEVFLAEPVGSCTDLVATVSLPLEKIYHRGFVMAPYAVLVDPYRAMQTLGLNQQGRIKLKSVFSADVNYIYNKQLDEAEIIVINKVDVLPPDRLELLRDALTREFPTAHIMAVASREGVVLEDLFEKLLVSQSNIQTVMAVDYERYGRGEALLGWVNGDWELKTTAPLNGDALLLDLLQTILTKLNTAGCEVAHLKGTLTDAATNAMAAVSVVRGDGPVEARLTMTTRFLKARLLLNLRAEGDPQLLREIILASVSDISSVRAKSLQIQSFRPGQPNPTHRVSSLTAAVTSPQ